MFYVYLILLIIILLVAIFVWIGMMNNVIGIIRKKNVPYIPLENKAVKSVVKNCSLDNKESIKLVDLGAGDGRVLFEFEKNGVKDLTGYEINWWAYLKSRCLRKVYHSQAKLQFESFLTADLSKYDVVFCYLLPNMLTTLREKFDKELKPGTIILSATFEIKDWRKPIQFLPLVEGDWHKRKLYIYKME